jgi:hypothetical protein
MPATRIPYRVALASVFVWEYSCAVDTIIDRIAERYLDHWIRAAGPPAGGEPRLLVVDATSDAAGDAVAGAGTTPGAPPSHPLVARLDALRAAPSLPSVLIVREDPIALDALQAALEVSGWGNHTRRRAGTEEPVAADPGAIVLIEASIGAIVPALLPVIDAASRAFVRLSPPTPAALPFSRLQALAERPEVDLLLQLPLHGLARLARFRGTPVADLPLHLRRLAEGYSSFLGDARWEWLALWRAVETEAGTEAAQARIAAWFHGRLADAVPDTTTRSFDVALGGAEGGTLQLVLTTREPERVLLLNRILFDLRNEGVLPWPPPDDPWVRLENPGVLDLFPAGDTSSTEPAAAQSGPRVRVVDLAAAANQMADRFGSRTTSLREVMRSLVGTELFPEEVRQVLRLLRRERRAWYTSLRSGDDPVRFGSREAEPAPRRRRSAGEDTPELW